MQVKRVLSLACQACIVLSCHGYLVLFITFEVVMNIPLYHLQATSEVSDGEEISGGFDDQKQNYVMIL